eukprot:4565923-Pyramimonas_sp.AAC.1
MALRARQHVAHAASILGSANIGAPTFSPWVLSKQYMVMCASSQAGSWPIVDLCTKPCRKSVSSSAPMMFASYLPDARIGIGVAQHGRRWPSGDQCPRSPPPVIAVRLVMLLVWCVTYVGHTIHSERRNPRRSNLISK